MDSKLHVEESKLTNKSGSKKEEFSVSDKIYPKARVKKKKTKVEWHISRQTDQSNRIERKERDVYIKNLEIFQNNHPNQKGKDGLLKDGIGKTGSL